MMKVRKRQDNWKNKNANTVIDDNPSPSVTRKRQWSGREFSIQLGFY
jgi:hypothetical protein